MSGTPGSTQAKSPIVFDRSIGCLRLGSDSYNRRHAVWSTPVVGQPSRGRHSRRGNPVLRPRHRHVHILGSVSCRGQAFW